MAKKFTPDKEESKPIGKKIKARSEGWGAVKGRSVTSRNPQLELSPGEFAGPLVFLGSGGVFTSKLNSKEIERLLARDVDGQTWNLPISATFVTACKNAGLAPGMVFHIKRNENEENPHGGRPMKMYELKVEEGEES